MAESNIHITSSVAKLVKHSSICNGELHPISAQIVLTDRCNLRCSFCITKEKDKAATNSPPYVRDVLEYLRSSGCKGVEFTGGGEPTTDAYFSHYVLYAAELGFDVGLVTNGVNLSKFSGAGVLNKLEWARVSLNSSKELYKKVHGVDRFDSVMDGLLALDNESSFYGISYIRTASDFDDVEKLLWQIKDISLHNLKYIRLAKDVSLGPTITNARQETISYIRSILPDVFVDIMDSRSLEVPGKCIMHKIKPCLDANGDFYPCCISQYMRTNKIGKLADYKAVMGGKIDYSPDVNKCSYCIYKEINDAALLFATCDVKNKNFI